MAREIYKSKQSVGCRIHRRNALRQLLFFLASSSCRLATAAVCTEGKTTCAIRLTSCNDVQLINTNYAEHVVHKTKQSTRRRIGSDRIIVAGCNRYSRFMANPFQRWKVVHLLLWIVRSMARLVAAGAYSGPTRGHFSAPRVPN